LHPLDCLRSGRSDVLRFGREFERSQYLSSEELEELAWERLIEILKRATAHIPYYRDSFQKARVRPEELVQPADLLKCPILEKKQLQQHLEELVDPNWPKEDLLLDQTGGSTGTPVRYYRSHRRHNSREAATWRHNRWTGWNRGDRFACLWGALRDQPSTHWKTRLRNLLMTRGIVFNTAGFQEEEMLEFHDKMKSFRPKIILAYANSITLMASLLKRKGGIVYQPNAIVCSAEMLSEENRALIESTFGCPVYNRYGCREFSIVASECEQRNGLHLMQEGLYVEILGKNGHALPGEVGELLVTDLLNEPMPLIRYRIGDRASWKEGTCRCGRGLKRLEAIAGRSTDYLVGVDGRLCSGAVLTVAMVARRPSLGQVQILQDEPDRVVYRVASGKNNPPSHEDLRFLEKETERYLGEGMKIDYEFVDQIPHEPSGKFLFSKSTVSKDLFFVKDGDTLPTPKKINKL
jgi:phenylacetate-CoA ligase